MLRGISCTVSGLIFAGSGLAAGACVGRSAMSSGSPASMGSTPTAQGLAVQRAHNSVRPVVICGPSGVGKGTLIGRLMKDFPGEFGFSVSHTTRSARAGEEHGVHYYFTDRPSMEAAIACGEFIEWAHVHNNIYGTSVDSVKKISGAGKTCILDIDVQGADSVKKTDLQARYLFIAPPQFEALEARLRGRNTETEESLRTRLATARIEMSYLNKPGYFEQVIVNDDLETAYSEFKTAMRAGRKPSRDRH